jgi:hypothetical protein
MSPKTATRTNKYRREREGKRKRYNITAVIYYIYNSTINEADFI